MEEITIVVTEEELTITKKLSDKVGHMLVHEWSRIPAKRDGDKAFNRLAEGALAAWYAKCGKIIKNTLESEAAGPKIIMD